MIATVDAVITIANKKVVLIKRKKPPFMDKYAFPGGHVENSDASLKDACSREILEEIGLSVQPEQLKLVAVLDKLHRDPRYDASLSVVYGYDFDDFDSMKGLEPGSDASKIIIKSINELKEEEMAFDHWEAIKCFKNQTS